MDESPDMFALSGDESPAPDTGQRVPPITIRKNPDKTWQRVSQHEPRPPAPPVLIDSDDELEDDDDDDRPGGAGGTHSTGQADGAGSGDDEMETDEEELPVETVLSEYKQIHFDSSTFFLVKRVYVESKIIIIVRLLNIFAYWPSQSKYILILPILS